MKNQIYNFERKSVKAWSWTRMKKVTQYYWSCSVTLFGEKEGICTSNDLLHNREAMEKGLENFLEAIKQGRYTKDDVKE